MVLTVDKWSTEFELETTTVTALADKGFKSKRSLSNLNSELIKKEFKGLAIGKQLLLKEAV